MRARCCLARRDGVRAGGGGGRCAVRGVLERRHRHRACADRECLGRPRPPPRLLGPPRPAPYPRLPRRLHAPPARRTRSRAATGPVRSVAAPRRLHRPRAAGTATPPPSGLDAAGHAVVRRGRLSGELERAGYGAAGGGRGTRPPSAGPRSSTPPQGCSAAPTGAVGSTTTAGHRSRRCSSTTASATIACTPCPTATATPGSGGACLPSTIPSPTSLASHSSTCWRSLALCWKRARSASSGTGGAGECPGVLQPSACPARLPLRARLGWAGVQDFTARGVPRCEHYGVVPLARIVQQSQYHPSLPVDERGSPTVQPPGKGRSFSRTGRKRLRQELRAKPGHRQARRPKTAQQPQGPGTTASARDKAELTTRHPTVHWGLEPGPPTASTMSGQDRVGAEQGAGDLAHPCSGSTGPNPATAQCGATPVPAMKGRRQQGPGRGCRCNKHLGKCDHQIAPHEVRYQLHNVDSQTLLHCNCTRRLARCLHRARDCSNMDVAVLADRVAMDCFVLELPAGCSAGRRSQHSCTTVTRAVLVPARQLRKTLKRWRLLHVSSKAKHPDWKTGQGRHPL